jgi:hypothetical protein
MMRRNLAFGRRRFVAGGSALAAFAACATDEDSCLDDPDGWADGGTAAMTAGDCYPDPFAGGASSCALVCEIEAGPCTSDAPERRDISEDMPGLPLRLALLVVDGDGCTPVVGARVEAFHAQRTGVYSGRTPAPWCGGDDPSARERQYFRGTQTTDAAGRVDFDTCFPGWYPGRPVHIHLRIVIGDRVATSQLFFAPALVTEIFADHPDYREFGEPDTSLADDEILAGADPTPWFAETSRMPDGAMLAAKTLVLAQPSCMLGA